MVSSADSCLYLSVCVVMGAIAMILCFSWMFVRKYFKGPDVDWELLNRQNELELTHS
jgi:vacuolar-type H+-ATPase subunit I/STV1